MAYLNMNYLSDGFWYCQTKDGTIAIAEHRHRLYIVVAGI